MFLLIIISSIILKIPLDRGQAWKGFYIFNCTSTISMFRIIEIFIFITKLHFEMK